MAHASLLCHWPRHCNSSYHPTNKEIIGPNFRTIYLPFTALFVLTAALHAAVLFFLEYGFTEAFFVEVYLGNFAISLLFLWGLLAAFSRYSHYVAWLYMLASGLKFALFFLLLWPLFKQDGAVSVLEKTSFLIPYFTGLFLETGILISKLNKI